MDIIGLKYFIKVSEKHNFTKAAKELYITQQALSKVINNLEEEIGAPLFIRNSRGVVLTELGEYVLPKAKRLTKEFDSFLDDAKSKAEKEQKVLKVGFSPGTLRVLGVEELVKFGKTYLDIDIDIRELSDVECEDKVLSEELDIALTVKPVHDRGLKYIHLLEEDIICLVHRANPLAQKDKIKLDDLQNEKLILLDDSFRMQKILMDRFQDHGFVPDVYFRSSHDLDVAYELVNMQKGVFIFVEKLTNVERYQNIVVLPLYEPDIFWEIGFILKNDTEMNYATEEFINYFIRK